MSSIYVTSVYNVIILMQIRFYVVEKATGKVVDSHFTAPNCCIFHHINAYEEDGIWTIIVLNYTGQQELWQFGELGKGHQH